MTREEAYKLAKDYYFACENAKAFFHDPHITHEQMQEAGTRVQQLETEILDRRAELAEHVHLHISIVLTPLGVNPR